MEVESSRGGTGRHHGMNGAEEQGCDSRQGGGACSVTSGDAGVVEPGLRSRTRGPSERPACSREVTRRMARPQAESGKRGTGREHRWQLPPPSECQWVS